MQRALHILGMMVLALPCAAQLQMNSATVNVRYSDPHGPWVRSTLGRSSLLHSARRRIAPLTSPTLRITSPDRLRMPLRPAAG